MLYVYEEKTHPCIEVKKQESETMTFDVYLSMDPARKPLRVCNAFGGTMEPPRNMEDIERIKDKCESCYSVWVPIFKESEEEWKDRENKEVQYLPWKKGQPNGGNRENCASLWLEGSKASYGDTGCGWEANFYCKIKDFQVFQLRGMCEEKEETIDRKYVLRLKDNINTRPTWRGFLANSIQWNYK